MKANKRIITNTDNTVAIYLDKCPYGYRLYAADRNLAGEWCKTFHKIEANIYKTLKAATERAKTILA